MPVCIPGSGIAGLRIKLGLFGWVLLPAILVVAGTLISQMSARLHGFVNIAHAPCRLFTGPSRLWHLS
jgi:hypothetical protein